MRHINEISSLPGSMTLTHGRQNTNGSGFIYKILPLNTKFVRKTDNTNVPKCKDKQFKPGDHVKGKSVNDNKWYEGKISRIKTTSTGTKVIAYVQTDKDNIIIPLAFNTLRYKDQSKYNYNFDYVVKETLHNKNKKPINTINEKRDSMNSFIHNLVLEYFDNQNTQLKELLKDCEKENKKYSKLAGPRKEFIISILGRNTYNKYTSGEFAPVPLSALSLTLNDFARLSKETKNDPDNEKVKKFIQEFRKSYYTKDVNFVNNGITLALQTNIVFRKLDDIIDFFYNVFKAYKKIYKNEDIDWTIFVKKFRNYLK